MGSLNLVQVNFRVKRSGDLRRQSTCLKLILQPQCQTHCDEEPKMTPYTPTTLSLIRCLRLIETDRDVLCKDGIMHARDSKEAYEIRGGDEVQCTKSGIPLNEMKKRI